MLVQGSFAKETCPCRDWYDIRYFHLFCFSYASLCCSDLFTVTHIVFIFDGHILSACALAQVFGGIHVLHSQVSFTKEPLCWYRALLQKRRAHVEIGTAHLFMWH